MTRILMVLQPSDGGSVDHVVRLSEGLTAAGDEVVVCAPPGPRLADFGVPTVPLAMERAVSPRADAAAVRGLAGVVRSVRPDLIHAHSSKAGALARGARPAYPRTPVVYTPHGYAFAGHFDSERERSVYLAAERVLAPATSLVLAVCAAEARLAREQAWARRTAVVHNGVPEPEPVEPHPALAELRAHGPVIGSPTMLRPGKGLETLIDALPAVLADHPDATLAIAGDGPLRAPLDARARELGIGEAVRFLGRTPGAAPLLAGVDLMVNPSWAESFPYSILEAMSRGLGVVATDVGGTSEAVTPDTGVLVPPRDPGALGAAIAALIGDPGRLGELGEAAGVRARNRFSLEQMLAGTRAAYARSSRYSSA